MNNSKNDSKWRLVLAFIVLIVFIIMAMFIRSLTGKTTITTSEQETESIRSITCTSEKVKYSMFDYNEADDVSLKINSIFDNKGLKAISILYKLMIEDDEALAYSEARNHALLNKSFYDDGLGPDSFDAKYGIMENELQFSLYARADELNSKTLKYVMLGELLTNMNLVEDKIINAYTNQGLTCIVNNL